MSLLDRLTSGDDEGASSRIHPPSYNEFPGFNSFGSTQQGHDEESMEALVGSRNRGQRGPMYDAHDTMQSTRLGKRAESHRPTFMERLESPPRSVPSAETNDQRSSKQPYAPPKKATAGKGLPMVKQPKRIVQKRVSSVGAYEDRSEVRSLLDRVEYKSVGPPLLSTPSVANTVPGSSAVPESIPLTDGKRDKPTRNKIQAERPAPTEPKPTSSEAERRTMPSVPILSEPNPAQDNSTINMDVDRPSTSARPLASAYQRDDMVALYESLSSSEARSNMPAGSFALIGAIKPSGTASNSSSPPTDLPSLDSESTLSATSLASMPKTHLLNPPSRPLSRSPGPTPSRPESASTLSFAPLYPVFAAEQAEWGDVHALKGAHAELRRRHTAMRHAQDNVQDVVRRFEEEMTQMKAAARVAEECFNEQSRLWLSLVDKRQVEGRSEAATSRAGESTGAPQLGTADAGVGSGAISLEMMRRPAELSATPSGLGTLSASVVSQAGPSIIIPGFAVMARPREPISSKEAHGGVVDGDIGMNNDDTLQLGHPAPKNTLPVPLTDPIVQHRPSLAGDKTSSTQRDLAKGCFLQPDVNMTSLNVPSVSAITAVLVQPHAIPMVDTSDTQESFQTAGEQERERIKRAQEALEKKHLKERDDVLVQAKEKQLQAREAQLQKDKEEAEARAIQEEYRRRREQVLSDKRRAAERDAARIQQQRKVQPPVDASIIARPSGFNSSPQKAVDFSSQAPGRVPNGTISGGVTLGTHGPAVSAIDSERPAPPPQSTNVVDRFPSQLATGQDAQLGGSARHVSLAVKIEPISTPPLGRVKPPSSSDRNGKKRPVDQDAQDFPGPSRADGQEEHCVKKRRVEERPVLKQESSSGVLPRDGPRPLYAQALPLTDSRLPDPANGSKSLLGHGMPLMQHADLEPTHSGQLSRITPPGSGISLPWDARSNNIHRSEIVARRDERISYIPQPEYVDPWALQEQRHTSHPMLEGRERSLSPERHAMNANRDPAYRSPSFNPPSMGRDDIPPSPRSRSRSGSFAPSHGSPRSERGRRGWSASPSGSYAGARRTMDQRSPPLAPRGFDSRSHSRTRSPSRGPIRERAPYSPERGQYVPERSRSPPPRGWMRSPSPMHVGAGPAYGALPHRRTPSPPRRRPSGGWYPGDPYARQSRDYPQERYHSRMPNDSGPYDDAYYRRRSPLRQPSPYRAHNTYRHEGRGRGYGTGYLPRPDNTGRDDDYRRGRSPPVRGRGQARGRGRSLYTRFSG